MAVGQTDAVVAMADGLAKRPRRVLHGLGGVGKTQLAIRFAQEHRSSYDVVWGTRAGSSAQLAASHVELGRILGIVTSQIPIPEAVSTVRRWLAEHDRWLLVFDAAAYLRRRSGRPHDADATELAADLGCLPLALDQALSHCEASATSFSDCRSMYAEMSARVLARSPVPDDHPDSVPATIALAVRGAATMHPAVTDALSLCSVLARRPVLLSMLTAAAPHLPEPLGPALAEPVERNDLVVTMRRFSVVERLEEEHLVLHRLTQDTTEVGHDDFRVPKPCRARGWRRMA